MQHQLNPIYQPQGINFAAMLLRDVKAQVLSAPRAEAYVRGRNKLQEDKAKAKYLAGLTKKWQDRKQIAAKVGCHPTSVNEIMKRHYMQSLIETRQGKTGSKVFAQWRLK